MKLTRDYINLIFIIGIICAVAFVVGLFFFADWHIYLIGLFIGASVTAVRLFWLERSVGRSLNMEKQGATNYMRLTFLARYAIMAVVLVAVFLTRNYSMITGVIIGLISLQPAAYIFGFTLKRKSK